MSNKGTTSTKSRILPGTEVLISYADHTINDPAVVYNGQTFVVKSKHTVRRPGSGMPWGTYYELHGAVGADNVPYVFLEEDLIRI